MATAKKAKKVAVRLPKATTPLEVVEGTLSVLHERIEDVESKASQQGATINRYSTRFDKVESRATALEIASQRHELSLEVMAERPTRKEHQELAEVMGLMLKRIEAIEGKISRPSIVSSALRPNTHILILGNAIDGFSFIGPFANEDEADAYADKIVGCDTQLAKLVSP